ncbi:ABC transporter substrate-binding protein [Streptomyces sp. NPDC052610]|uniref:ABC transporter substrate-binding protein n=1 Tax=Streptomyces sp. NPDC052610 TaxID=3154952 RepID=UPI003431F478
MKNAKIGAALLGGYVLGRTKKGKLAIGLGSMLAGSRINPAQVGKMLQDSPFVDTLTKQVRTELAGAGKAAATSVLTAKADNLADALHARTTGLRDKAHAAEDQDTDEEEDEAEAEQAEEAAEAEETGTDETEGTDEGDDGTKKASSARSRPRRGTSKSRRPDDG